MKQKRFVLAMFILVLGMSVWAAAQAADKAVDPVCGMSVATEGAKWTFDYKGTTYYFCGEKCKTAFVNEPEKFLAKKTVEAVEVEKSVSAVSCEKAPAAEKKCGLKPGVAPQAEMPAGQGHGCCCMKMAGMKKMPAEAMMPMPGMPGQEKIKKENDEKEGEEIAESDAPDKSMNCRKEDEMQAGQGCCCMKIMMKMMDRMMGMRMSHRHMMGGRMGEEMPMGPGGMMGPGMGMGMGMMGPGMMMKDVEKKVETTKDGVVITITSKNPETVKKIQEQIAKMAEREAEMMKKGGGDKGIKIEIKEEKKEKL
jgi:YHS domain-containing protein/TusA-related sulfurtransferase